MGGIEIHVDMITPSVLPANRSITQTHLYLGRA
jgi:hypothetical protein